MQIEIKNLRFNIIIKSTVLRGGNNVIILHDCKNTFI